MSIESKETIVQCSFNDYNVLKMHTKKGDDLFCFEVEGQFNSDLFIQANKKKAKEIRDALNLFLGE